MKSKKSNFENITKAILAFIAFTDKKASLKNFLLTAIDLVEEQTDISFIPHLTGAFVQLGEDGKVKYSRKRNSGIDEDAESILANCQMAIKALPKLSSKKRDELKKLITHEFGESESFEKFISSALGTKSKKKSDEFANSIKKLLIDQFAKYQEIFCFTPIKMPTKQIISELMHGYFAKSNKAIVKLQLMRPEYVFVIEDGTKKIEIEIRPLKDTLFCTVK